MKLGESIGVNALKPFIHKGLALGELAGIYATRLQEGAEKWID